MTRPRAAISRRVGPLGPTASSIRARAAMSCATIRSPNPVNTAPRARPFPARATVRGFPSTVSARRR